MFHGYFNVIGSQYSCDQCDYTPKAKVTMKAHMIDVHEVKIMNFTNRIFINSYIDTIKLLQVQNILVTNVNIQQNGN